MQDIGASSIEELREMKKSGQLRFELRSPAAQREGEINSVFITDKR